MVVFSLFLSSLLALSAHAARPSWVQGWKDIPQLVKILRTIPEGRAVLARAEARAPHFASEVKTGTASFTESTFSRTYSLMDGREQITLHHDVTIDSRLSLADAVVDLAHELVHLTDKGMLDPYRPGFELREFIRNGIEGDGGELAALAVECKVAWSLEAAYEAFPLHKLCERYRKPGNAFHREAARRDYYSLGGWFSRADAELRSAIPELSSRASVFTSSYAGKPYPLALAEEYAMTRKAACDNNRRKYRLIASQTGTGRQPASTPLVEEQRRLKKYDWLYCRERRSPSRNSHR